MTAPDQQGGVTIPRIGDELLVTPEEAARRLSLGRTTIYELIGSRRLESVLVGRSRRVPTSALTRFVEDLARHNDSGQPRKGHLAPTVRRRLQAAEASVLALPGATGS